MNQDMHGIIRMLRSKKFWYAVAGSAVCTGLQQLGVPMELVGIVGGLFGTAIISQGVTDVGKNGVPKTQLKL
jgi:hypothetical protein